MRDDNCKKSACKIQTCLKNNDFDDSKCTLEIMKFYDCCLRMNKQVLKGAASSHSYARACPKLPAVLMKKDELLQKKKIEENGN